ncbi:MAG: methylmalonyl-CoA mutase family protein [Rhodothermales bacterium]
MNMQPLGEALDLARHFPPPDPSAWLKRVAAELKGQDLASVIDWTPAPGIAVRALYPAARPGLAGVPFPGTWTSSAWIGALDDTQAPRRIATAAAGGADTLAGTLTSGSWPAAALPAYVFAPHASLTLGPGTATGAFVLRAPADAAPDDLDDAIRTQWVAAPALAEQQALRFLAIDLVPAAGRSLPVQLGLALSATRRHIELGLDAGWPIDTVLGRMLFTVPTGRLFFPELARLRALRATVDVLLRAYQPDRAAWPALHIVAETERCTDGDPYAHALRTTPMALAAIIGGCDALIIHPGRETDASRDSAWDRLALNTHHVLRYEAQIGQTADAAGGAGYVEHLTDQIARKAWRIFQAMERDRRVALGPESLDRYDEVA